MTFNRKQPSQNQKIPQVQGNTPSFCELEEQACSAWLADVEVPGEHEPVASHLQASQRALRKALRQGILRLSALPCEHSS